MRLWSTENWQASSEPIELWGNVAQLEYQDLDGTFYQM